MYLGVNKCRKIKDSVSDLQWLFNIDYDVDFSKKCIHQHTAPLWCNAPTCATDNTKCVLNKEVEAILYDILFNDTISEATQASFLSVVLYYKNKVLQPV